ncbi:MAG: hypothetical protein RL065_1266 [Bacteroidota bacterium]|jgi:hypothetical protein
MKNILSIACLFLITVSAHAQIKKVLLEDYTATWCGFCPQGSVTSDNLKSTYGSNYIFIQNHTTDGLEVTDGATLSNDLAVSFYPNGTIDRYLFPGNANVWMNQSNWTAKTAVRIAMPAIVSVSFSNLNYNSTTRVMDVDVNVVFSSMPLDSIKTINLAIVEDSIPASGSNAQTNYSSSVQGGASPLTNWWHNHVLRDWIGASPWGDANVIPNMPTVGTTYTKHYTDTLPSTWNANQCYLVGTVSYYGTSVNNREVLNSEEIKLYSGSTTGINSISQTDNGISIYPNPAQSSLTINFNDEKNVLKKVELRNNLGQVILELKTNEPLSNLDISKFARGFYFVKVSSSNKESVSKFIKH